MVNTKALILHPAYLLNHNGKIEYRCLLERTDNDVSVSKDILYFKMPEYIKHPPLSDMDGFTVATVMMAMHEKRELHIMGEVSGLLLSNLTKFMNVWIKWKPDEYFKIKLTPNKIKHITPSTDNHYNKIAISVFSGGVDATFTIWSHHKKLCGFRSKEVVLSLFVHGFDIPLCDAEKFNMAFDKSHETLNSLGIDLVPVETNFRSISKLNWEHSHCTGLAACLHFFNQYAPIGLIGSSFPYNDIVYPWGSSPIADHLLSSEQLFIEHDRAGYSRNEKVKFISEWPLAMKNLRVCWQGEDKSKNCNQCEKCIRTKLNFLATNCEIPSSLGSQFKDSDIFKIHHKINHTIIEYTQIYRDAKQNGITDKWVFYLSIIIFLHKTPYYRILRKLRKIVKLK